MSQQPGRLQLAPGESLTVPLVFDTNNKQGKVHSKVVINYYLDPQVRDKKTEKEYRFQVEGFVKRMVTRDPPGGLIVRTLDPKAGTTGTVRLENQMPEPLKLRLQEKKVADFDIEVKEITPGQVYEVTGRTTKDHTPGTYKGTLVFATGWEKNPTIEVPIWVTVIPPVKSTPPAIYLDPKTATGPSTKVVLIQCFTGLPFNVTGWHCDIEGVKVQLGRTESMPGRSEEMKLIVQVRAQIMLPPAKSVPPEGFTIEFTTNKPECPKVEVFVTTSVPDYRARAYGDVTDTSGNGKD